MDYLYIIQLLKIIKSVHKNVLEVVNHVLYFKKNNYISHHIKVSYIVLIFLIQLIKNFMKK